jgi:hypothetical protein
MVKGKMTHIFFILVIMYFIAGLWVWSATRETTRPIAIILWLPSLFSSTLTDIVLK